MKKVLLPLALVMSGLFLFQRRRRGGQQNNADWESSEIEPPQPAMPAGSQTQAMPTP
jgi:hypothetical protein